MVPLHGLAVRNRNWTLDELKRAALFVDSFYVVDFGGHEPRWNLAHQPEVQATAEYLQDKKILRPISDFGQARSSFFDIDSDDFEENLNFAIDQSKLDRSAPAGQEKSMPYLNDAYARTVTSRLSASGVTDLVPLLTRLVGVHPLGTTNPIKIETMQIAIDFLPTPDETTPWQDIVDFRLELSNKLWEIRRFMASLATQTASEAEVRDEIEWRLHEFEQAIRMHKLKAGTSFVETIVIPASEAIENLVKFNWSKIAKGVMSVTKRKLDMLEAENKAPGRECAYLFRATERFNRSH